MSEFKRQLPRTVDLIHAVLFLAFDRKTAMSVQLLCGPSALEMRLTNFLHSPSLFWERCMDTSQCQVLRVSMTHIDVQDQIASAICSICGTVRIAGFLNSALSNE